jgi:hypothetical protein
MHVERAQANNGYGYQEYRPLHGRIPCCQPTNFGKAILHNREIGQMFPLGVIYDSTF